MSEHKEPIPSMLYNAAVGGHVTNSQQIIDENLNREQSDVNQEVLFGEPYNATTPNGMGRIVLKKTDNFKEVVEAQTNGNTIFVIKYDFTLTGNVTVPANCILKFEGGSISGAYTITGNNTDINAGLVKIFGTDVTIVNNHSLWTVKEVYPEWFGAKGDGITDDTAAIQKAADFASETVLKFTANSEYLTGTIYLGSDRGDGNTESQGVRVVRGDGLGTIIRAKTGTTTLLSYRNTTNRIIENLWLQGPSADCTLIDTDVTFVSAGPMVLSVYRNIRFSHFGSGIGFKCRNNNDCIFEKLDFEGGSSAINCIASGGNLQFRDVNAPYSPIEFNAQNVKIDNCVAAGLHILSGGWNSVNIIGGYIYPDSNGINIDGYTNSMILNGVHIENLNGGSVFGGKINGGVTINGGHIFSTSNSIYLLHRSLSTDIGADFTLNGVYFGGIDLTSPSTSFSVSSVNCNDGYSITSEGINQVVRAANLKSFLAINELRLSQRIDSGDRGLSLENFSVEIAQGTVMELQNNGRYFNFGNGLLSIDFGDSPGNYGCYLYAISTNNTNVTANAISFGEVATGTYEIVMQNGHLSVKNIGWATVWVEINIIWFGRRPNT